jgi:hypothetical protein
MMFLWKYIFLKKYYVKCVIPVWPKNSVPTVIEKNMFCFQDDEKNEFKTCQSCRNARRILWQKQKMSMILTERGEREEHLMEI